MGYEGGRGSEVIPGLGTGDVRKCQWDKMSKARNANSKPTLWRMSWNLRGVYDEIESCFCRIIRGVRIHGNEGLREKSRHEACSSHRGIEIDMSSLNFFPPIYATARYSKWEGGVEKGWRVGSTTRYRLSASTQVERAMPVDVGRQWNRHVAHEENSAQIRADWDIDKDSRWLIL